jgi:hypothetical protein
MIKVYYFIGGISSDATSKEIENAFKDADKRVNVHGFTTDKTIYGH